MDFMELLDKFNFAVDALDSKTQESLKQEEIIFSDISSKSLGFSVTEQEFKELADALEDHFHHILAPAAKRIDFSMVNSFSKNVKYKETYSIMLKNLKQVLSYITATFDNRVDLYINLTSDQVSLRFENLTLRKRENEKSLLLKIKNNRFFNAKIETFKYGRKNYFEVNLTGSWSLQESNNEVKKSYRSQDGARKGQWESRL